MKTLPVSLVRALANPAPHVGKYYRPTGPELLDPHQIAAVHAKVLGRPVKYQPFSERMFLKAIKVMGLERHFMAQAGHYFEENRRCAFEVGAPNDIVLEVDGSPRPKPRCSLPVAVSTSRLADKKNASPSTSRARPAMAMSPKPDVLGPSSGFK